MKMGRFGLGWPRRSQLDATLRLWSHPRTSREALLRFQKANLQRVIRHAGMNIAYYRRLFEQRGLDPQSIRSVADLARIPPLSRLELRQSPKEDLMPSGCDTDKLIPEHSSGSMGIRLCLWKEPFERHLSQFFRMRAWKLSGVRISDKIAYIRAEFDEHWERPVEGVTWLRQAMGVFHTSHVSSLQSPEGVLADLEAIQPDVIVGYTSVIHQLARIVAERGTRSIRPRLILPGGETLIPPMRQTIEESLGARVVDTYGAMEFNLLAWQCPVSEAYHICDDHLVLEVLRKNGQPAREGETGEVVVTGLHSYVFPLIRYRMGDIAIRGRTPCACGAPFATLERIKGRTIEYYYRADGTAIHFWDLSTHLMAQIRPVASRYQLVQETDRRVVLRLLPSRPPSTEELAATQRAGEEKLGPGIEFEIRIEHDLPVSPSGKMMQSRNLVRSAYGGCEWDPVKEDRAGSNE